MGTSPPLREILLASARVKRRRRDPALTFSSGHHAEVRALDPWFLFPVMLGVIAWLGLYLREPRLRTLVALRG